ncbi:MAG: ATP-binding protein [Leptospiraceae bacterium]|nr:ATP-binding protein [Leptospiraceae bacterium]
MVRNGYIQYFMSFLQKKEILILIGPRQAGKTTVLKEVEKTLKAKNEKTIFFNLDIEKDKEHFSSQEDFLNRIKLEFGKKFGYVFIDEIQRKENAGLFLKGIYDSEPNFKIIASGSGSLELKENIQESLAGRKLLINLSVFTFFEFADYKTDYKYSNKLKEFFIYEKNYAERLLKEYLLFGGYPRVILEETIREKEIIISEIMQSYLEKDVTQLGIEKSHVFSKLLRLIAASTGKISNFQELASTLGISTITLQKYLWIAEKTFTIQTSTPYFTNVKKEITKAPIYYLHDTGFRNYLLGFWDAELQPNDSGMLFQSFIFNQLKTLIHSYRFSLKFWRTKDKGEIDIILDTSREQIPIEVKYSKLKKQELTRSFHSYIEAYSPKKAYVVNLSYRDTKKIKQTEVHWIAFYELDEIFR